MAELASANANNLVKWAPTRKSSKNGDGPKIEPRIGGTDK